VKNQGNNTQNTLNKINIRVGIEQSVNKNFQQQRRRIDNFVSRDFFLSQHVTKKKVRSYENNNNRPLLKQ
jgi:hypothetical protein